MRESVFFS